MRLHTALDGEGVYAALRAAQHNGKITADVRFMVFKPGGSRTHARRYEVQLGTWDKHSLPEGTTDQHGKRMRVRRFKNSGSHGASSAWGTDEDVWAATWEEWGWFIAYVFEADPTARFGAATGPSWGYRSPADFHAKTNGQFSGQLPHYEPALREDAPRRAQPSGRTPRAGHSPPGRNPRWPWPSARRRRRPPASGSRKLTSCWTTRYSGSRWHPARTSAGNAERKRKRE